MRLDDYFCSMDRSDISGYIDDLGSINVTAAIAVSENDNFRISRIVRHGRWWAVKSLGSQIDRTLGKAMLEKEFNLLIRLNHPRIVRAVEFVDLPELGWSIVMEWIEGLPISDFINLHKPSRSERQYIAGEIVDAMAYLHDHGFTHRDLNPSNVLVDVFGHVSLIDFGLGDDSSSCLIKNVSGTDGYVAPELTEPGDVYDVDWRKVDVYALGLMLRLVRGGMINSLISRKCLVADPNRRPADASAVRNLARSYFSLRKAAVALGIAILLIIGILMFVTSRKAASPLPNSLNADTTAFVASTVAPVTSVAPTEKSDSVVEIEVSESIDLELNKLKRKELDNLNNEDSPTLEKDVNKPVIDINVALLRALDVRDVLRYRFRIAGDTIDLRLIGRATDSLLNICREYGATLDEMEHFKRVVRSKEFYEGKRIDFYIPPEYRVKGE